MEAAQPAVGRVLATHLRNRHCPLIRYETGDVAALLPDGCGAAAASRSLRVVGRERDRLIGDGEGGVARPRVDRLMRLLPAHLGGGGAGDAARSRRRRPPLSPDGRRAPQDLARASAAGVEAFGPRWRVRPRQSTG